MLIIGIFLHVYLYVSFREINGGYTDIRQEERRGNSTSKEDHGNTLPEGNLQAYLTKLH